MLVLLIIKWLVKFVVYFGMDCLLEIVFLKVFFFLLVVDLGRVVKVCSDWWRLVYDYMLWKVVNIKR